MGGQSGDDRKWTYWLNTPRPGATGAHIINDWTLLYATLLLAGPIRPF